jgi:hypothetical protein
MLKSSAVQTNQKLRLSQDPGVDIGYVERDASRGKSILKRDALAFDSGIMESTGKAWEEVVLVLLCNLHKLMTSGKNIFARKKRC